MPEGHEAGGPIDADAPRLKDTRQGDPWMQMHQDLSMCKTSENHEIGEDEMNREELEKMPRSG